MNLAAVIPVRNRPLLIQKAIRSIQAQTAPVDEIIVVDDGSTDDTPAAIEALARADPRIKLIRNAVGSGAARARNIGVAATQCEWIGFLDSDDEWLPQKLERQLHAVADSPSAVASVTGVLQRWSHEDKAFTPPRTISLFQLRQMNYLGSTSSAIVRRSAFASVNGFDESMPSCQDWDLWFRLRQIGDFAIVQEPLVVFNQTETVRITSNETAVFEGHRLFFDRALFGISSRVDRRTIVAAHAYRLAQIQLYDIANPAAALRALGASMLARPTRRASLLMGSAFRALARQYRARWTA